MSIQLDSVRKEFGDLTAVERMDLTIEDGEFFCLLGPSGCGKTTTLRMIAGLETQTDGDVSIGGEVVNDVPPKDRELAMVFQHHAVYPHLNVFENLAFPLRAKGVSDEEIDERVRSVATTLGIEEKVEQGTADLSGGQRQRVALGRAMIRSPRAFLMDEPLSSLDANLRRQMRVELTELQSELETTIIYVTHDQVEAMTMADRIAVLRDGEAEQVGEPLNVYNEPDTVWVAQFLGDPGMNTIEGVVTEDGVELTGEGYSLSEHTVSTGTLPDAGEEVIAGIRPENVVIDERSEMTGEIVAVEQVGDATIVHLETGEQEYQAQIEAKSMSNRIGDTVPIGFDERIHFFEPDGNVCARVLEGGPWHCEQ
jgi:multiple sugar transport system ATP-binding protein